ncbi:MAG TPA: ATP-binding protein, partial [Thermomicrobiales bacterium]|nr:ATP-binding protein [Thermomicrobiales bacterium]
MDRDEFLSPSMLSGGPIAVSPTDVAQYVRLDQCRRFLRLRLHELRAGQGFLRASGVAPQEAPPLLSHSGVDFEDNAVEQLQASLPAHTFTTDARRGEGRDDDNAIVAETAKTLLLGATLCLLQPRLRVELNGWMITGDIDVLRLDRGEDGRLSAFIADVKSSDSSKVEHRLQVAFYHEMLRTLFAQSGVDHDAIELGILYQGTETDFDDTDAETVALRETQRVAATERLGVATGYLECIEDAESYVAAVRDLVTGPRSAARETARAPFAEIPFHLTYKCDWCRYNAFCTRWCAERDDLSLIPHLTDGEKRALIRAGVTSNAELATLKEFANATSHDFVAAPGKGALVTKLAATWPVGPRLDELVHRARRYRRFKGDDIRALPAIPHKGHGSLPYSDATHNPNLIRVYLDAQHDYLTDSIYLAGALVVASEGGEEPPHRRRGIVHLTDGPADAAAEETLLLRWIEETIRAIVELAAPDEDGAARAPIHLIFFNRFDQRLFLEGLGRHATGILGATPLYDFVTQLAAFDSPIATFLVDEIRELKNYPMVCQSLQAVARFLKFDWNSPEPFTQLFHTRLFDHIGRFAGDKIPDQNTTPWYTARSRFNSQIPLEYAYAAWNELAPPTDGSADDFRAYRRVTPDLLRAFQARRLEAMEWIAKDFPGNKLTQKRSFELPDLAAFEDKGRSLAHALDEFVVIERHVELGQWKTLRHLPAERRLLAGETLIVRYDEADQDPDVRLRNREHRRRDQLRAEYERAYRQANPEADRVELTKEQKEACKWSQEGLVFRLHVDLTGVDCDATEALNLTALREDDGVIVFSRFTVDERLPPAEQTPFPPTPKQMLYGTRARILKIVPDRNDRGDVTGATIEIEMKESHQSLSGFTFRAFARPFVDGERYTLDSDPNSWYGYWSKKVTEGLIDGGENALYDRLAGSDGEAPVWSPTAEAAQRRFLDALDALHAAGKLHGFEPSKREFIAGHGATPALLVQGPPGTGKSYTTAFALLARVQGAMAAGEDFRVFLTCKTHSATDVLVRNLVDVKEKLRTLARRHPEIVGDLIDERLYDLPIFRIKPRGDPPYGTIALDTKAKKGETRPTDRILANNWCVVAAPPGGTYSLIKDRWNGELFGHFFCDCLVLDEASQMNLPEAIMAALPLKPAGRLIVVGDHRQMPPIIKHDWLGEPRRTFKEFKSYQSLFTALQGLEPRPPMVRFERSFRLHADMAEFLRQEVYRHDGIHYHSERLDTLPAIGQQDDFVAGVLAPGHPLVVVVHDEAVSQHRNPFERDLMAPVFAALTDARLYGEDDRDGYGIVVPHRAQRSALKDVLDELAARYPTSPVTRIAAVDTVERFQGDERAVIIVSATESDREYLIATGDFLLDPR